MSIKITCDVCGKVMDREPDLDKEFYDLVVIEFGEDEAKYAFDDLCDDCMAAVEKSISDAVKKCKAKKEREEAKQETMQVQQEQQEAPAAARKPRKPRVKEQPAEQNQEAPDGQAGQQDQQ